MKRIFNYNKFDNETYNTLVESFGALCDSYIGGHSNSEEYKEANAKFNEEFMKECISAIPNMAFSSVEQLKNPMIHNDLFMLQRFNTLLAQMITPVVPTIIAAGFENLYDVTQVGFGDSAKYFVKSNELFIVSDSAMGVARGGLQTIYNTEYTVRAQKKEVACYVDLTFYRE